MKPKTTYYAIINGNRIEGDTLPELRNNVKLYIKASDSATWDDVSGIYQEKNGKITKKYDR